VDRDVEVAALDVVPRGVELLDDAPADRVDNGLQHLLELELGHLGMLRRTCHEPDSTTLIIV
jgi:hypothetical protein